MDKLITCRLMHEFWLGSSPYRWSLKRDISQSTLSYRILSYQGLEAYHWPWLHWPWQTGLSQALLAVLASRPMRELHACGRRTVSWSSFEFLIIWSKMPGTHFPGPIKLQAFRLPRGLFYLSFVRTSGFISAHHISYSPCLNILSNEWGESIYVEVLFYNKPPCHLTLSHFSAPNGPEWPFGDEG